MARPSGPAAFRANPHAWVKLWKHHAAQPEADRINAVARATGQPWLDRYGGRISSEWFFSKALQILDEAPEVYAAADRLIEAADWVVWRLTGVETRNACTAGYKAMWSKRDGFPDASYFAALDPRLANVIDEKMSRDVRSMGERAGGISEEAAAWTGLRPGTAVAVANVDAHVAVPAATVVDAGRMVMIMGTSTCHVVLSRDERAVPGMCGYVEDGVIPGFFGYEAGQSLRRRPLQLVRRACRAGGLPRRRHERAASTSTSSSRRRRAGSGRASQGCSRSTGGTATARCWSTPSSAGC